MTQQVLRARTIFRSLDSEVDNPSVDMYFEQIGSDTDLIISNVDALIENFWNTAASGAAHPIAYYLSGVLDRSALASTIEYYDITAHLSGTAAGSPIAITNWQLGPAEVGAGGSSYPEQCAAGLGYRVDYGTDVEFGTHARPRARDRNRFYIGPLHAAAFDVDSVTHKSIFATQFKTDVLKAAAALMAPVGTGADITAMVVWSRVNAAVKQPITECWLNDSADTQRRRKDQGTKTFQAV